MRRATVLGTKECALLRAACGYWECALGSAGTAGVGAGQVAGYEVLRRADGGVNQREGDTEQAGLGPRGQHPDGQREHCEAGGGEQFHAAGR